MNSLTLLIWKAQIVWQLEAYLIKKITIFENTGREIEIQQVGSPNFNQIFLKVLLCYQYIYLTSVLSHVYAP